MSASSEAISRLLGLNIRLTDAERGWQQKASAVARRLAPYADEDFEAARFRAEFLPLLAEAGLFELVLRHDADGAAVGYGLACLELEAVDSAYRTLLSVQGSLTMTALARFGSDEHKTRWLPGMVAGTSMACFALTEPQGGSDPAAMTTHAVRDGSDWVISGSKRWIGYADQADVAIVWARTSDGIRGFVVETSAAGYHAAPISGKLSMRASVQCDLHLDAVHVPGDAQLPGANGLGAALACLTQARYGIAWGAMGAARSCLEAAVDRATTREVFGATLARRQLTQAKLADMFTAYQTGVLLALHLGRLKESGDLTSDQVSVGKLNNVRQAQTIARTSRSLLGGDGITAAFPVMRHMANLESVATYEGTEEIHQLIIGRALTGEGAFA